MSGGDGGKEQTERKGRADEDAWLERPRRDIRIMDERQVVTGMTRSREETLADWLGPERTHSVFSDLRPMHDDVGGMVDKLLEGFSNEDAVMLSRLDAEWMTVFDASIARLCRPLSIKDGHLQIEVHDATVMFVFEHQKKDWFLQHLSQFSGGKLKSLSFVVAGVRSRRWTRPSGSGH